MGQKGLFFNAFPNDEYETGYDRNYSADDISDWLKAVITTGIIKTGQANNTSEPTGLKIVASSGLNVSINAGLGCIDGKPYVNDTSLSFTIATPPTGSTPRYDCFILRMDNTQTLSARRTYILTRSLDAIPTVGDLERTSNVYELLLGYVVVQPNATAIQQTDIVDLRGDKDFCPWVVTVKGYEDYYDAIVQRFESDITIGATTNVVVTNLAVSLYNEKYSLISVYCNGLREDENDYTVDTSNEYITIRFTANKSANAEICVILENFIDGEGLENVMEQYNELVNDVENLKTAYSYTYVCNGVNDNVEISNIVNNFFTNNKYRYNQGFELKIVGSFGYTAPMAGEGTPINPFIYFNFEKSNVSNRRVMLDFSNCSMIEFLNEAGKSTTIFSGVNICIKGANMLAINSVSAGTSVVFFATQPRIKAVDCRFWAYGYSNTYIATRGEFINCLVQVRNAGADSYCYPASNGVLLSIVGGQAVAHTGLSNGKSAGVYSNYSNAMISIYNLLVANIDLTNYYQTNSILHTAGKLTCFGLISTLAVSTTTGASVNGTLVANPYNQVW